MDTTSVNMQQPVRTLGNAICGSLCDQNEPSSSELCVSVTRPNCLGNGCLLHGLDLPGRVPVSSVCTPTKSPSEDNNVSRPLPTGGPQLAEPTMVSTASGTPCGSSSPSSSASGSDFSTPRKDSPSGSGATATSRVAIITRLAVSAGFPLNIAEKLAATIRPSTSQVYESKWSRWNDWCHSRKIDICNPSSVNLCTFFSDLFQTGISVSAIKGYRSALNSVFRAAGSTHLLEDHHVSSLMRAFSLERPVTRKFFPAWDLPKVLRSLMEAPYEPMHEAELRYITKKTVFLLTLASGKRRSEVCALSYAPSHLRFSENYSSVRLLPDPSFRPKTQKTYEPVTPIVIPSLQDLVGLEKDRLLCPIRALKYYIERTKAEELRRQRTQLFIPFKTGSTVNKVTPAMISRWLCSVIFAAYHSEPSAQDSDNVKITAHEIRALAASFAVHSQVPINEVLQSACWKSATTFTSHYLRDVCVQSGELYSLGPIVAAQHIITDPSKPGPSQGSCNRPPPMDKFCN